MRERYLCAMPPPLATITLIIFPCITTYIAKIYKLQDNNYMTVATQNLARCKLIFNYTKPGAAPGVDSCAKVKVDDVDDGVDVKVATKTLHFVGKEK